MSFQLPFPPPSPSRSLLSHKRALLALPAAVLAASLLTGCDGSAKAAHEASQALKAALVDYDAVATSHLAVADKKGPPQVAYHASTAWGSPWADHSQLATRQDQYDLLAKRFEDLAKNPAASPTQQALALATLSDLQHRSARQLLRRADLDRTASLRLVAGLHGLLGKIELLAIVKNPAKADHVVTLIEQGESAGVKSISLPELAKERDEATAAYDKVQAEIDAATKLKADARAKTDALFAKAADLQLEARHTPGAKRFDILDQASAARGEAEAAEAAIFGLDQQLDLVTRQLQLLAKTKVALEQSIVLCEANLKAAKDSQQNTGGDDTKNDAIVAKLHDQWLAEAKAQDAQFNDKVMAPLAKALATAQAAQATLAKAEATDSKAVATPALDRASLATTVAQIQTLQLRALEAHQNALLGLVNREKVWAPEADTAFIATRVAELGAAKAAAAAPAAEACAKALETIGTDETLKGLKTNVEAYQKAVKEITKTLPADAVTAAPAKVEVKAEPKAEEAKPEVKPEPKAEEPKAEEVKAEPKAEEPKAEAKPEEVKAEDAK